MAPSHNVPPADSATDRLSSSVIGIVSTNPAATAAIGTAARANVHAPTSPERHHSESALPTVAPHTMNASVPATVLSGFHGQRAPPIARPASVATPSPAARMPHAAAT